MNQLLKTQVSDLNYSTNYDEIRIENTNLCGYKCYFCPREELTRKKGVMPVEDLVTIINQIGDYRGSVDLHGFGEPLLDTDLPQKIRLIKSKWPHSKTRIISTLGLSLSDESFKQVVNSGLDTLEVSFYGIDRESYKKSHGVDKFELVRSNLTLISNLIRESSSSLEMVVRDLPIINSDSDKRKEIESWLLGLGVNKVSKHNMHNYGGGREYNQPPTEGVCSVVWGYRKRVLQVTWDLNIIPCCFDSNSTIIFGNLRESSLEKIFQGKKYIEFINSHKENNLSGYPVCEKCERCFKP
ncbi:radical SAM/SPASM domain-containing protein [Cellvibrio mixtus]|uniref:radical SAM/SPASM domain-containing protein n=1 Tax=Cellvibrio mixtus TaxID=39650 RepID=UPI000587E0A7|nr:radical SAM/SPASM domain-containing protein [Cellvibrio mixtus]